MRKRKKNRKKTYPSKKYFHSIFLSFFADICLLAVFLFVIPIYCSDDSYDFVRTKSDLTEIPTDIPANSTGVNLESNHIDTLSNGVFSTLTECTVLRLSNNDIRNIEPGAFAGLRKLTELYLDGNAITELTLEMFTELQSLRKLDLQDNNIRTIENGSFQELRELRELCLNDNDLEIIRPAMWEGVESLSTLNLGGNSISTIENGCFDELNKLGILHLHQQQDQRDICGFVPRFAKIRASQPSQQRSNSHP